MPKGGRKLHKADWRAACIQGVDNVARFRCGVEPIGIKAHHAKARGRPAKGIGQMPAMVFSQIKIIHGARDIEIRIGIKAARKAEALIAQIAFHLEIRIKAKGLA